MELLLIALLVVVVIGGVAFVATRGRGGVDLEPPPGTALGAPPITPPVDTPTVEEAPPEAPVEPEVAVEPEVIAEPPVVEAPPAVQPRFRDRLGKASTTLSGYLGGLRASGKVDDASLDHPEEAALRRDVGVHTHTHQPARPR